MVEGTAGNTGIGLAHMCNALGYKCVIFMPNTQSQVSILVSAPISNYLILPSAYHLKSDVSMSYFSESQ